jgi:molybdopterin molybdotransferase
VKPLVDAQREVLAAVPPLPESRVSLARALGLVLAADVVAPHDVPPFDNSAMDGFAVRGSDVASAPVDLDVVEDVAAGHVPSTAVAAGSAIRIMTGAPMPEGADTVVRVEDTEIGRRPGTVRILVPTEAGTAVRRAGGDVAAGTVVMTQGTRLGPAHLGVLATLGVTSPRVARRWRVAILSTGDEVQPVTVPELRPGWIRDANRPLLAGLLGELGAEVVDIGIVGDDPAMLRTALRRAVTESDAVVTSGGVSVGVHDLLKQVLSQLGDVALWQVAMQPAKPFAFGLVDGVPVFGLPGNPVSVLVAFEQFVRPALLAMSGALRLFRPRVPGVAGETFATDPAKTVFLRVVTSLEGGRWVARSAGDQSSNVLSAAAAADALAVVPAGTGTVAEGEPLDLELLLAPETRGAEEALDG